MSANTNVKLPKTSKDDKVPLGEYRSIEQIDNPFLAQKDLNRTGKLVRLQGLRWKTVETPSVDYIDALEIADGKITNQGRETPFIDKRNENRNQTISERSYD